MISTACRSSQGCSGKALWSSRQGRSACEGERRSRAGAVVGETARSRRRPRMARAVAERRTTATTRRALPQRGQVRTTGLECRGDRQSPRTRLKDEWPRVIEGIDGCLGLEGGPGTDCGSGGYRFNPGWSPFARALFAHPSTMGGAASSGVPPFEDLASVASPVLWTAARIDDSEHSLDPSPVVPAGVDQALRVCAGTSPSCSSIKSRSNIRLNVGCFPSRKRSTWM